MNRSKQKGDRGERKLVEALRSIGLSAQRVPLSGAAGGEFQGDVETVIPGTGPAKAEVKVRAQATGWTMVKKWLGDNSLLALYEDRKEPLVVMPWAVFVGMVLAARDKSRKPATGAPEPQPEPEQEEHTSELGIYRPPASVYPVHLGGA